MPPKKASKGKSAGKKAVASGKGKRVKAKPRRRQVEFNQVKDEAKTVSAPPSPTNPAFPIEIFRNILKFALPRELSRCTRVSPAFHELAGPLLYSNIVIKRTQLMLKVILGLSQTHDGSNSTEQNSENRKARLLSHVQQITVADHYCVARISAGWFPNFKTLLILPYADTHSTDWICGDHGNCLVLNSQYRSHPGRARLARHPLRVACPTLTLVINDIECGMGLLPERIIYKGVDWARVKEIRVIVNRTPPWLDKIAERASYPDPPPLGSRRLAMSIILPLVLASIVPLKFYLFQDMDEVYLTSVQDTLAATLKNTTSTQGRNPQPEMKVPYTFNTLSDYITEGLEDELIWQELKYWREENQRRMEIKEVV